MKKTIIGTICRICISRKTPSTVINVLTRRHFHQSSHHVDIPETSITNFLLEEISKHTHQAALIGSVHTGHQLDLNYSWKKNYDIFELLLISVETGDYSTFYVYYGRNLYPFSPCMHTARTKQQIKIDIDIWSELQFSYCNCAHLV